MKKYAFIYALTFLSIKTCTMGVESHRSPVNSLKKQCIKAILSNPRARPHMPVLPEEALGEIRNTFCKQSTLLRDMYAHNIEKKEIPYPSAYTGRVAYDKYLQKIIVNTYDEVEVNWNNCPVTCIAEPCYHVLDLDGKIIETHQGKLYNSANFASHLSPDDTQILVDKYALPAEILHIIKIKKNIMLEVNAAEINLYNIAETKKIKNFCEKCMTIEQILLLSTVEQTKNNKLQLKLTEKEQKIYSELLPEIKEIIKSHVRSL